MFAFPTPDSVFLPIMDITLTTKKIGTINEDHPLFIIPGYQRGYRWTTKEVERLLDDIPKKLNSDDKYCLQPVVVRKINNTGYRSADGSVPSTVYELIDGQQRLTTLLIIQKMIYHQMNTDEPTYEIEYVTRKNSKGHLNDIATKYTDSSTETFPDFWFMNRAAETVANYLAGMNKSDLWSLLLRVNDQLEVIWYEARNISDEDANRLFSNLNIGKIPLTNSELVKALFLREAGAPEAKQRAEEISLLWDQIEIQLNDEAFWGFLTATSKKKYTSRKKYATRIDLILEMMVPGSEKSYDHYHTFFYFDKLIEQGADILEIWRQIYETYLVLLGWYRNPDNTIFHLVGYLLGSDLMKLRRVYDLMFDKVEADPEGSDSKPKSVKVGALRFKEKLIHNIITGLYNAIPSEDKLPEDETQLSDRQKLDHIANEEYLMGNYSYLDTDGGSAFIHLILLLYNMIGEMEADERHRQFPLARHLDEDWSLEHIHARKSASLQKNEEIRQWLESHIKAVKELFERDKKAEQANSELLKTMQKLHDEIMEDKADKARERYGAIYDTVWPLFSKDNEINDISNLALLSVKDNAALSNSVFEVKRQKISQMDADGKYIPWGTRRVFFKNFKGADSSHPYFWSPDDRKNYVKEISETVKKLL